MPSEQGHPIGAAARLCGLKQPVIRVWEKRYGAVRPLRTGSNRRLYSETDVERLTLMRHLTEAGAMIGSIATLELAELAALLDRLRAGTPPRAKSDGGSLQVLTVGPTVTETLRGRDLIGGSLIQTYPDLATALGSDRVPRADLLALETDTLFPETVSRIRDLVRRSGARRTLLLHRFTQSQTATALARGVEGISILRAPVDENHLRRELFLLLESLRPGSPEEDRPSLPDVPPRRYSPDQLARLARISSTVECECPQHLAELLQSLSAFERYSRECEDRNPEDALLHAYLHRTTAQVRRTLEDALHEVVVSEQIEL